ncbi:hypothetical protein, partial [Plasmodium yoelii yoelii]
MKISSSFLNISIIVTISEIVNTLR